MKKSLRLFLALLLIGGFALSFSSCKDSENVSNDPNSPENIALSKESESAVALAKILSYTSELDSLPDNWASNSYTVEPTVGTVLDESTPYVRYIATNNKEGAINHYNSIVTEKISKDANSAKQNIENVGSLSFQVLDQPDVIATLDINIKQQPHLTQIRFVPASVFGTNDGGTSYYSFGDVVSLTENGQTSYWICARPCSKTSKKYMSHWFSFQLNDLEAKKSNFVKFTKSDYPDYILPTDLGNDDKAERHIPNLIKLLAKLSFPNRYEIKNGLGELKQSEFDEDTQEALAYYWEAQNLYKTVLPFGKTVLNQIFNNETSFGVFYNGYSYKAFTPHVWMSKVQIPENDYSSTVSVDNFTFKSGRIGWKRTQDAGCDFRNYAQKGIQTESGTRIKDLPEYGLVVRYKSGNQLIDKSGNDKDMTKSFTAFSKNIKDVFVYKTKISQEEYGKAVVGDVITNPDDNSEVCALNSSDLAENHSFFFKYYSPKSYKGGLQLCTLDESKYAYANLMTSLVRDYTTSYIDHKDNDYEKLNNIWNKYPELYRTCINNMIYNLGTDFGIDIKEVRNLVNFKYNNVEKYFSLTFPYHTNGQYGEAELKYYYDRETYKVISKASKFDENKAMLSLKTYRDSQLNITLKEGQKLVPFTEISMRKSAQQETLKHLKSLKFE